MTAIAKDDPVKLAIRHYEGGRAMEARTLCESVLAETPDHPEAAYRSIEPPI